MVLMDCVLSRNCLSFDDNDKRVREHPTLGSIKGLR